MEQSESPGGWGWKTLLGGILLWAATAVAAGVTANPDVMPALILIGSFLVPFSIVMVVIERSPGDRSEAVRILLAFVLGGALGVASASVLELGLPLDLWIYCGVGCIEEAVKGAVLLLLVRRHPPQGARQGALFGAVIGAGFAAFESAGYAYRAASSVASRELAAVVQGEVTRAALAPLGHPLWTAILAAALFAPARSRAARALHALAAFVTVVLLHALWDSMDGISQILALAATGDGVHVHRYAQYFAAAANQPQAVTLARILYPVGIGLVSAVGVGVLALLVVPARRSAARPVGAAAGDTGCNPGGTGHFAQVGEAGQAVEQFAESDPSRTANNHV